MQHSHCWLILIAILAVVSPAHAVDDPAPADSGDITDIDEPLTNSGAVVLQTLEYHRWTLATAVDGEARPIDALFPATGRPYMLNFSASTLSFQGGCNSFFGPYQINPQGKLEAGDMRSTMMACEPELLEADTALVALLAQPLEVAVIPGVQPQLQLKTAANETLGLEGQVTPEAKYGPATLMFLEVDARQLACRNPRNAQTTCIQVREISFDEQGLRIPPPGPWQPFYDTIDGYTHTPGERNVLRVKRFERGPVAGNAAPYLYVLDIIIESETVPQSASGTPDKP